MTGDWRESLHVRTVSRDSLNNKEKQVEYSQHTGAAAESARTFQRDQH